MQSSNDDSFDPRAQLLTLSEEQAVEYAKRFVDQNCEGEDAAFLSEVITAGDRSPEVTYRHALSGSPIAQLAYGVAKLEGVHVEKSISEGLFWLRRSYNNGNAKAAIVLAGVYMQGAILRPDLKRALTYATFASDRELPAGQYILANLLIGGGEIPEDQERAIGLLQAAAKNGYAPATKMLQDSEIPLE
jgi:TPR repeat protein